MKALALGGGILLAVGIVVGGYFVTFSTAEPRGQVARNGHFHDLCASAQRLQHQLQTAKDLQAVGSPDTNRQAQLDADVAALTHRLTATVHQYNADARTTDTRAPFLAPGLPYQLSTHGDITCTA